MGTFHHCMRRRDDEMAHSRLRLAGLAVAILMLAVRPPAWALEARELLDRMRTLEDTTRHWKDRTQTLQLVTQLKSAERRRELRAYSRRYPAGEDKSVFFFTGPAEVRGVGFLQWDHGSNDGEQWLFTPETGRTRRIATQDRGQSFMGTAFSYRDL